MNLLIQKDGEFQEIVKVALEQGKTQEEMHILEKEMEKRDGDIQQLQKQLKEAEHVLVSYSCIFFKSLICRKLFVGIW